jgi:hypothetical protein
MSIGPLTDIKSGVEYTDSVSEESKETLECSCAAHLVVAHEDLEIFHCTDGSKRYRQEFYLTFFEYGHNRKPSLKQRLVSCWHLLRKGTYFEDMVVLSPEEALKLGKFLTDKVNKYKQEEVI